MGGLGPSQVKPIMHAPNCVILEHNEKAIILCMWYNHIGIEGGKWLSDRSNGQRLELGLIHYGRVFMPNEKHGSEVPLDRPPSILNLIPTAHDLSFRKLKKLRRLVSQYLIFGFLFSFFKFIILFLCVFFDKYCFVWALKD